METYIKPEIVIIDLDTENLILTSGCSDPTGLQGDETQELEE